MTNKVLYSFSLLGLLLILFQNKAAGQVIRDSTGKPIEVKPLSDQQIDSVLNKHSPRKAAIRSAIIPGWGQAYNKKYWKIPIVYAALGTTAYIFFNNINYYKDLKLAYAVSQDPNRTNIGQVEPNLVLLIEQGQEESIRYVRDNYRRYVDYSVVAFILLWGLNVVDATVDAHLKSFDVSPDLSFRIKPGYSELGNTHGISLVLAFK